MNAPHLLRVEEGPDRFAPLAEATRALGLRIGWLELAPPPPVPGSLETAAAFGALRAVGVGGGRSVVVKPLKGEPVLADLLREHFRGCVLVLVQGEAPAPLLAMDGERWTVTVQGEAARGFTVSDLAEALRSPRPPWAPPLPPRVEKVRKKPKKKTKAEKKAERRGRRKEDRKKRGPAE